jgi:hypothetical protein
VRLQARLSDYAFIRAAPDTSAEIIIVSLPPKTALTTIGRTGDYRWFQVEYQGQVGWIWETNVRVLGPIPSLPVTLS